MCPALVYNQAATACISSKFFSYKLLSVLLKEISPGSSMEGLRLKLKLQNFGHLM